MPSLLIIDDEPQARETLRSMLAEYCPDAVVLGEANGVRSGLAAIRQWSPDAVLLDIRMNDGTGFELLEKAQDYHFKLIFTTAYDEFALKAFRYHAIDYLLKPIDPDQLAEAIGKVNGQTSLPYSEQLAALFETLKGKKLEKLALQAQGDVTYIRIEEILYLKSDGNYTRFFLKDGSSHLVSKPMLEYDELLPEDTFFRIHQSYIVHGPHVRKFLRDENVVMINNGDQLPVAKRRRQEFLDWLK